ncbi:DUF485 domain-containing protein [Saccharopolyspora elongata]|uniref:DUF485 domain-containing protein n=1 Tax=Saccharopolyspora elongata TaxID=2530387 RepID=A0A4R4YJN8_9PSEU|nr:DUF485 domain-containing protein [Saccharopolyspora elongata]TDD44229.1 DUF485 domain-containing protein [Saccharopolyspora elongata]
MPLEHSHPPAPSAPVPDPSTVDTVARRRMRLVAVLSVLICVVFFPLPVLGQFTGALDGLTGGGLTWAWIYAFAQFPAALAVAAWYAARARRLDQAVELVREGRS